jgi:hypothetical protein
MENKSILDERKIQENILPLERMWNGRHCPQCGIVTYGMPGGRDAHCINCGYKDPCCGD